MRNNLRDVQVLARLIARRFVQDRCAQTAASLTFTTLLSLVPMITIALTVFSAFPVFEDFSSQIKIFLLNNLMPDNAGKIITQYMQQFADSATRLTAVGIIFLAVTAMAMLLTIDKAFNVIWQATRPRPLVKRLVAYWAVLTLAPLLIGASLSLTSWLVGISMGHGKLVSPAGISVLKILPVFFTTLAFALLFRLVPNRHVSRRHALIGAAAAAVLFETMNQVFGYFISHFPTYTLVYGAFASVPIFLMWIYLSWLTILLGAVIAASLPHWRIPDVQHVTPAAQLLDALRVLQIIADNFQQGRASTLPDLSKSLHLGYDALEKILETLVKAGMVCQGEGGGWLLMRDVSHIRASEVLHLFVLDRSLFPSDHSGDPLQQWLADCVALLEQSTDITLQELFARRAA
ncbi:MAG: YihY family inner membrane protein [Nitrosomonadales bacterium]|nr:YihY family inner membrane protein [Nitrosomonadales bacterium]